MHVRICGINAIHDKNFKIEKPVGFGDYLFLRLKSPTRFHINGEIHDGTPDDIFLFKKGDPQYYENLSSEAYSDDFLFFDVTTDEDQIFIDRLPLIYNRLYRFPNLPSLMAIHQIICEEHISQNSFSQTSLDCLLKYFLIKLSEYMNTDNVSCNHELIERFTQLRRMLYNTPAQKWTVPQMAAYVNLSPSYFQNLYKKFFHISCMADLFASRLNYAKQLLSISQLSVSEIALRCGYESNIYFARHFKKKTGMTPTEYRNQWRA